MSEEGEAGRDRVSDEVGMVFEFQGAWSQSPSFSHHTLHCIETKESYGGLSILKA